MAVDVIYKRHDTFPPFKTTLKQINQESKAEESIDLKEVEKVTALIKGVAGTGEEPTEPKTTLIEIVCTAWAGGGIKTSTGAKAGQVEIPIAAATLSETGEFHIEFELEWKESGGVKRFQTVPNEGYRSYKVIADLGTA